MHIDVLTIFPRMFEAVLGMSIIKRAQKKGVCKIDILDLRNFSKDKHKKVDDKPFGGGPGMIMSVEPFFEAVSYLKNRHPKRHKRRVILTSPKGSIFNQRVAKRLSRYKHLILLCGHYEGIDERVREYLVDEEISLGDFVLTGGEIVSMAIIDAVVRLLPGALGNRYSSRDESFSLGLLEYPHYTRPADYKGMNVPEVLLSGNHRKIDEWRKRQSLKMTREKRPDLMILSKIFMKSTETPR